MDREAILITLISIAIILLVANQIMMFLAIRSIAKRVDRMMEKWQGMLAQAASIQNSLRLPSKGIVPALSFAYFLFRKVIRKKKEA